MVLRLITRSPRGPGFLAPVISGIASTNLMPASGHQDHTTSPSAREAPSSEAPLASTASRPASMTIASRPSVGRDGAEYAGDLGLRKIRIFLREGLDKAGRRPIEPR